jgi:hypothetical protein
MTTPSCKTAEQNREIRDLAAIAPIAMTKAAATIATTVFEFFCWTRPWTRAQCGDVSVSAR